MIYGVITKNQMNGMLDAFDCKSDGKQEIEFNYIDLDVAKRLLHTFSYDECAICNSKIAHSHLYAGWVLLHDLGVAELEHCGLAPICVSCALAAGGVEDAAKQLFELGSARA